MMRVLAQVKNFTTKVHNLGGNMRKTLELTWY
jgi:hypothetical protein